MASQRLLEGTKVTLGRPHPLQAKTVKRRLRFSLEAASTRMTGKPTISQLRNRVQGLGEIIPAVEDPIERDMGNDMDNQVQAESMGADRVMNLPGSPNPLIHVFMEYTLNHIRIPLTCRVYTLLNLGVLRARIN